MIWLINTRQEKLITICTYPSERFIALRIYMQNYLLCICNDMSAYHATAPSYVLSYDKMCIIFMCVICIAYFARFRTNCLRQRQTKAWSAAQSQFVSVLCTAYTRVLSLWKRSPFGLCFCVTIHFAHQRQSAMHVF